MNKLGCTKQVLIVSLFVVVFYIMTFPGEAKYFILLGLSAVYLCMGARIEFRSLRILIHVVIYAVFGLLLAAIWNTLSLASLKQVSIYLLCGLYSLSFFWLMRKKNSKDNVIDLQFYGLAIAYLGKYGILIVQNSFQLETSLFAYIFGIYCLVFFMQKKFPHMILTLLLVLIEGKRIVFAALVVAFVGLCFLKLIKGQAAKKVINRLLFVILFLMPFIWVYLCSTEYLTDLFANLQINTMGRLEGTSAWNAIKPHYFFGLSYIGKGAGWVLDWLADMNFINYANMHNDYLAAYIELGFVGFAFWNASFLMFIKMGNDASIEKGNLIGILLLFTGISMLTDNIYIYITFLIPFYIIILETCYGARQLDNNEPQAAADSASVQRSGISK